MFQALLSNIAILLFMHLCIQSLYINQQLKAIQKPLLPALHILITSAAIISMYYMPIFSGEYRFDLRTIPMTFIAFLHGPIFAIPTLIVTSLWRMGLGGPGAVPGVLFGLLLPTIIALSVYYFAPVKKLSFSKAFVIFTLFWLAGDIPIIFALPNGWTVFQEIALTRFLSFQIGALTLYYFISLTTKHMELVTRLEQFADRDPLTGLYNIRKFVEIVEMKKQENTYIAMLDIDFFKNVNDNYGHQNGDKVLSDFASILKTYSRKEIEIGRYGGEEFIMSISAPNPLKALELVNNLRQQIEEHTFYSIDQKPLHTITVSIGIAPLLINESIEESIYKADRCLYQAKLQGRNQIVSSDRNT